MYKIILFVSLLACSLAHSASVYQLQKSKQFVVQIECSRSGGSGVIVAKNKILTAAHVVADAGCVAIDDKFNVYYFDSVLADQVKDIALITLSKNTKTKGVRLANKIAEYAKVWTIGFPLAHSYFLSEGRYNYTNDNYDVFNLNIIFGNSGGGIFVIENNEIKLLSIVSAVDQIRISNQQTIPVPHIAFGVTLKTIKKIMGK